MAVVYKALYFGMKVHRSCSSFSRCCVSCVCVCRMGFLLNQSGHLHSHGHTHSHGSPGRGQGQRGHGSLAVRAAFIHALGDLVQSVGVLIAAYIVRFKVRPVELILSASHV